MSKKKVITWIIPALCVVVALGGTIFENVVIEMTPTENHVYNPNLSGALLYVESLAVLVLGFWGIVMLIKTVRRVKKTLVKVILVILAVLIVPAAPGAALLLSGFSGHWFLRHYTETVYISGKWCADVPEAVRAAYTDEIRCPEGYECYYEEMLFAGGTFERIFDTGPIYWVDMDKATKAKLPCKSIKDINPNLDRPYTTEEERKTWVTLPGLPPLPPEAAEELKQQGY